MSGDWPRVKAAVEAYTDDRLAHVHSVYDDVEQQHPIKYGPRHHDPESPPVDTDTLLELVGGIVSVLLFYTPERRETVLVYNPAGAWEPPGGVVEDGHTPEEMAAIEANEETGLRVTITDAAYTRRIGFNFADGRRVELPLVQYIGHRRAGTLSVEREGRTHPGTTRATGLFDRETLPALRRDEPLVRELLNDPPGWDGCDSEG